MATNRQTCARKRRWINAADLRVEVGDEGRVPIGTQHLRLERQPGTKVVLCLHPTGHHSVLVAPPVITEKPLLLFTNRPKS